MNKKLVIITLITLSAPVVVANQDHFDRISLAIKSSDVVRTKSLVRQLDDLELSAAEKKKALHTFVKQATEVIESHPSLHVVKSFRDSWNTVSGFFATIGGLRYVLVTAIVAENNFAKFKTLTWQGACIPWAYYQFKKGFECYHQRKDYDKALRIENWLKEQKDNLS